jgi:hypothetical protein
MSSPAAADPFGYFEDEPVHGATGPRSSRPDVYIRFAGYALEDLPVGGSASRR